MTANPASLAERLRAEYDAFSDFEWNDAIDRCIEIIREHFAAPELVNDVAEAIYDSNREKYWPVKLADAKAAIQISIRIAARAALKAAAGDL
jgi:hypothetical protein